MQAPNSSDLPPLPISHPPELKDGLPSLKTEHGSRNLKNFDPFYVRADEKPCGKLPIRSFLDDEDVDLEGKFAEFDDPIIYPEELPKESFAWLIYSGIAVALTVCLVLFFMNSRAIQNAAKNESFVLQQEQAEPQKTKSEALSHSFALSSDARNQAGNLYKKFVTAKSASEIKDFVWNAPGNSELIEKTWTPIAIELGWVLNKNATYLVDVIESIYLADMTCDLPNGKELWICFRWDENREMKLDWRATTGYSSADFTELTQGKGDASEIRTHIVPNNFYTFSYPEDQYRSFKLFSPDTKHELYGYVPIGSEAEKLLIEIFIPNKITGKKYSRFPVLLALEKSSPDSLPNQWLIKKIHGKSWLER